MHTPKQLKIAHQSLLPFKRLFIGFSGGLDSTVLLHLLSSEPVFFKRLQAIHVHHGLSPNADLWQHHCEQWCQHHQIPLHVKRVHCKALANQEAAARAARYQVFDDLLEKDDALILAHHVDDQAETVLLQLSRGAGIDGLCAMWPARSRKAYTILRPFLTYSKQALLAYAMFHQLTWIEDESNQQTDYRRNYLRHHIFPQLTQHWPQVKAQFAQMAMHSQQACANLFDLACLDYPALSDSSAILSLVALQKLKRARLENVLWHWLKQQEVRPLNQHMIQRVMNELIEARCAAGKRVQFVGVDVWYYQQALHRVPSMPRRTQPGLRLRWSDFPHPLCLPDALGQLIVKIPYSTTVSCCLEIRFREGGETFYWRGKTKSLKKCYQEWHVPPWMRYDIPLLYANDELIQVVGYEKSDRFKTMLCSEELIILWERQDA